MYIKHMLYCRLLKCVLLNFVSNVGQRCTYLNAYVLYTSVSGHDMRKFAHIVIIILIGQSCAILDGYKDNQHSWYSQDLTTDERQFVDGGATLEKIIDTPRTKGKLIVMKGNPKYGKYNFVEIGDWNESVEYSSGDFIKGDVSIETTYDYHGNILKRTVLDKRKDDNDFHTSEVWTSKMELIDSDSILTQRIKTYNKDNRQTNEFNLGVLNYKEKLSDRLKTKIKIGTQKVFDDKGELKTETTYKYQDKVKAN
jgi:hypothetical protein